MNNYDAAFRKAFNAWLQDKRYKNKTSRYFREIDGIIFIILNKWLCKEWGNRTPDEIKRLYFGEPCPDVTAFRVNFIKDGSEIPDGYVMLSREGIVRRAKARSSKKGGQG